MGILDSIVAFWRLGDDHRARVLRDTTGRGNDLSPYLRANPCTADFRLGTTKANAQWARASLKGWGKWDRRLTAAEKTALASREYWPFDATNTLRDAAAYFLLDEPSNSVVYVDATQRGNNIVAMTGTTQVNGPGGVGDRATAFPVGVWLQRATPLVDLQSSSERSLTIAGWVCLNTKAPGTQQVFWSQFDSGDDCGVNVYYDQTSDRFWLDWGGGTGKPLNVNAVVGAMTLGSPNVGQWYHMIAEFDRDANEAALTIDNGVRERLGPVLQPVPDGVPTWSRFFLNPEHSFSGRQSGWDRQPGAVAPGNSFLLCEARADLRFGDNSKTVWGWFRTSDLTTTQTLAGFRSKANEIDWLIQVSAQKIYFSVGTAFVTVPIVEASPGQNHLVVAWLDRAANQIRVCIDNGAQQSGAAPALGRRLPSCSFRMGSDEHLNGTGTGGQFVGSLSAWGVAEGVPNAQDLSTLWSGGNGWLLD